MFETLTWLARRAEDIASPKPGGFRKLRTRRGDYFVDWAPGPVSALIELEGIAAGELVTDDPTDLHRLIRDLFLLGFRDELGGGAQASASPISRLARELVERKDRSNLTAACAD